MQIKNAELRGRTPTAREVRLGSGNHIAAQAEGAKYILEVTRNLFCAGRNWRGLIGRGQVSEF